MSGLSSKIVSSFMSKDNVFSTKGLLAELKRQQENSTLKGSKIKLSCIQSAVGDIVINWGPHDVTC